MCALIARALVADPCVELIVQGKPVARRGRKVRGLPRETARLPALQQPIRARARAGEGAPEMNRRSTARDRISARMALALAACAVTYVGSPAIAVSSAWNAGGARQPAPATFGDCKNSNSG